MARYRSYRDLDWPLLLISLIICGLGVLQIYSATRDTHWEDAWWKQLIWIGVALILMWVVTSIDYHTLLGQIPLGISVREGGDSGRPAVISDMPDAYAEIFRDVARQLAARVSVMEYA